MSMTTGPSPSAAGDGGANAARPVEPRVSLPARSLILSVIIAILLVMGFWSLAIALGPWGTQEFVTGMVGIAVTGLTVIAGVCVMGPWKQRAVADWMTMWLAGTVFRLLATPVFVFLLYSAASSSLAVKPLGLSVSITYLATLFVEAAVLARHMNGFYSSRPQ